MIYVQDPDFTLHVGDVREVLKTLPDESVDCVVTSPPYWGLRDYGTGEWEGGDAECNHRIDQRPIPKGREGNAFGTPPGGNRAKTVTYSEACHRCGATRIDRQLGLEPTPEEYVTNMVEVFREVRRVLAKHGTAFVNMGDSYGPGKQLAGVPWKLAFALQDDGWILRSDIIWAKPNPMPESVTDRPTKAHEFVFLLTKSPRYFFDQEAVRESASSNGYESADLVSNRPGWSGNPNVHGEKGHPLPGAWTNGGGRNIRSVWEIATQPYPEAHFATYPEALVERCLKAGCPEQVCRVCGKPRERIVDSRSVSRPELPRDHPEYRPARYDNGKAGDPQAPGPGQRFSEVTTLGFTDCGHDDYRPGIVLDPFLGSGTTALVARRHGRHCIGIELNQTYAELAAKRLSQLSLLAEGAA